MRALLALFTALALAVSASACSSDSSDGTKKATTTTTSGSDSGSAKTTTTVDQAAQDASEADYLAAFKKGLTSGDKSKGDLVIDKSAADCMAKGWLDAITVETLKKSQTSPDDVAKPGFDPTGLDLSEAQATAMVDTFGSCKVDVTALFVESLTQGMTAEQQACAAKTVTKEMVDPLLVKAFSGQKSDDEFSTISDALSKACKLG